MKRTIKASRPTSERSSRLCFSSRSPRFARVMRLLFGLMILASRASGQDVVDRSISGAEVWRAAEGPRVVRGVVTVEEGGSLTIEPGTAVEFAPDFRSGIVVRGRLIAAGSPGEPITMGLVGGNRADLPVAAADRSGLG